MSLIVSTQAWLLAGAPLLDDSGKALREYDAEGSVVFVECIVPRYWQYWLDEVTLDWLAAMEYAERMADSLVVRRRLPPHVVALTPVIRKIAEYL